MAGTVAPPFFVGMHDRLRIAAGDEPVAQGFQLRLQIPVVIDLPIEDHRYRPIFVIDRLVPAAQVDDLQPAHAQVDLIPVQEAFSIRATVDHRLRHPAHEDISIGQAGCPANSTHSLVR